MFYKRDFLNVVYEKYLEGISVDDITFYISTFTEYEDVSPDEVEEAIDFMNKFI